MQDQYAIKAERNIQTQHLQSTETNRDDQQEL